MLLLLTYIPPLYVRICMYILSLHVHAALDAFPPTSSSFSSSTIHTTSFLCIIAFSKVVLFYSICFAFISLLVFRFSKVLLPRLGRAGRGRFFLYSLLLHVPLSCVINCIVLENKESNMKIICATFSRKYAKQTFIILMHARFVNSANFHSGIPYIICGGKEYVSWLSSDASDVYYSEYKVQHFTLWL